MKPRVIVIGTLTAAAAAVAAMGKRDIVVIDDVGDFTEHQGDIIMGGKALDAYQGVPAYISTGGPPMMKKNGQMVRRHHPVPTTPKRFRPHK